MRLARQAGIPALRIFKIRQKKSVHKNIGKLNTISGVTYMDAALRSSNDDTKIISENIYVNTMLKIKPIIPPAIVRIKFSTNKSEIILLRVQPVSYPQLTLPTT